MNKGDTIFLETQKPGIAHLNSPLDLWGQLDKREGGQVGEALRQKAEEA
jgi:hypothetical protein